VKRKPASTRHAVPGAESFYDLDDDTAVVAYVPVRTKLFQYQTPQAPTSAE
jgi:hypothetical protein